MEPESSALSDIKDATSIEVEESETSSSRESTTDPSSSCESTPLRHPLYYSGELIVLQVDETLYHVEKLVLCQFDTFRDMFEGASPHNLDPSEGASDDNPIILQGITRFEMDSLVSVLSARWYKGDPKVEIENWKAILHLSTMWEFGSLRDLAIRKIEHLKVPALDSLLLATKCRVTQWLKPAYVELCSRSAPISDQEAELLGLPVLAALCRIREARKIVPEVTVTSCSHTQRCRSCRSCRVSGCAGVEFNQTFSSTSIAAIVDEGVDKLIVSGLTPSNNHASHTENIESSSKEPRTENSTANEISGYMDYLDDCTAPVILRVENTLYRLPRGIISRITTLQSRLQEAFEKDTSIGLSDECPIVLSDVTTVEFEMVLLVFSARWFKRDIVVNLEQWRTLLLLGTLWESSTLKRLSVSQIDTSKLPAMDLIFLSHKCQVPQWLVPAYTALCTQFNPLTMEEGHVLGFELFVKLAEIRERRLQAKISGHLFDVDKAVRRVISGS
ncbi:hypothetical protein FRC02_003067 [Tulasnella sp. 418]|nr:hypothetical protein FRC02_003067 [Tulasnella sp. 418]